MTTSSNTITSRVVRKRRRAANEYPAHSLRFDLIIALLSSIFIEGEGEKSCGRRLRLWNSTLCTADSEQHGLHLLLGLRPCLPIS